MSTSLKEFRVAIYGVHRRKLFALRHRNVLRFVGEHPETGREIGIVPCDSKSFFMNSSLYSQFCGLKKNSMNRDVKQHGFAIDKTCNAGKELENRFPNIVSGSRQWVKRVFMCGSFNGQSSDEEAAIATEHGRQVRNGRLRHGSSQPSSNSQTLSSSVSALSVPIREETAMKANVDVVVDAAAEAQGENETEDVADRSYLTDEFPFDVDSMGFSFDSWDGWDRSPGSMFRF
jgi:hypothetical protein